MMGADDMVPLIAEALQGFLASWPSRALGGVCLRVRVVSVWSLEVLEFRAVRGSRNVGFRGMGGEGGGGR